MSGTGTEARTGAVPSPESGLRADEAAPVRSGPVSTCRLQLHANFDFEDTVNVVPYLARLGVTDLYTSPLLTARSGSMHGYDISDHGHVNPELGGEEGFDALSRELHSHGMGLIMDFVPNHMGVDDARGNRWWWDVLENGTASRFARWFDIDWTPVKRELAGRVLLPVLGSAYGEVLERGQLQVAFDRGTLVLNYFDHRFPIDPRTIPAVLSPASARLAGALGGGHPAAQEFMSIVASLENLPDRSLDDDASLEAREREKRTARYRLSRLAADTPQVAEQIADRLDAVNGSPGDPASFDALHALLESQAYRLAHWRTAFHEINYRRFFDVNGLASLRMEEPEVFEATHGLVLRWAREGRLDGLRLDHIDGLFDPVGYLRTLRSAVEEVRGERPFYVVAEKILSPGESLRDDWLVEGTTGYDFLNDVNGLFVDPAAERRMAAIDRRFTRRRESFADVVYGSKRAVMDSTLASELNVLAHALNRISEGSRRDRDFTLNSLRTMLREVVACFPVYRTYVVHGRTSEEDLQAIRTAVGRARRRNPDTDPSIFVFLEDVLLARGEAALPDAQVARRRRFAMQFQQFTGPVKAKGLEDTAFYRCHTLISLDEVGGAPQRFGLSPEAFHAANQERHRRWPRTMLCTATHDTKRGEDVRARIDVLSELPDEWSREVSRWSRIHTSARTRLSDGSRAPDRNDEYLFYQTLLGIWPTVDPDPPAIAQRMTAYMLKATREAKQHTSWIHPNADYEQATSRFVETALSGAHGERFLAAFLPFQRRVAAAGMVNSLAQVVLKLTSPGVPDFYQGSEAWDLSLVDPDNRRPVDFAQRSATLESLEPLLGHALPPATAAAELADLLARWENGRIKMFVTAAGLRARRAMPDVFVDGSYLPLEPKGDRASHVVALARRHGARAAIAVVPRLFSGFTAGAPPLGDLWRDTALVLPRDLHGIRLRNVFTGATLAPAPDVVSVAACLDHLPVALFVTE
jgi:(1->4)-alpha-D-glucan 1-alpha-D-glucosylmutase